MLISKDNNATDLGIFIGQNVFFILQCYFIGKNRIGGIIFCMHVLLRESGDCVKDSNKEVILNGYRPMKYVLFVVPKTTPPYFFVNGMFFKFLLRMAIKLTSF
jgi:hypothetical protein